MDEPLCGNSKNFLEFFFVLGVGGKKTPSPLFFYGGIEGILGEGIGRFRKFWAFWTANRGHPQGMNIGRGGSKGLWG